MLEPMSFKMNIEPVYYPTISLRSDHRPEIRLHIVAEDIEAALVEMGSKDFRGPVQIRLSVPYYGKEKYAGNRMDNLLLDVDYRTVTCMVITDTVETFTFSRRTFVSYLRQASKEYSKLTTTGR